MIAAVFFVAAAARAEVIPFKVLFPDKLNKTEGIAVCPDGRLLVAETSGKVYKVVSDEKLELFFEGLDYPAGLACGADNKLYALEYNAGNVVEISPDGKTSKKFPSGVKSLNGAIVRSDGKVLFSDSTDGKVMILDPKDGKVDLYLGGIAFANGLVFSKDEKILYVASTTPGNRVYAVSEDETGKLKKKTLKDNLKMVDGVTRDDNGNIYACVFGDGKIVRITPDGKSELLSEGMTNPASPALYKGAVYATTLTGKGLYKIELAGEAKADKSEGQKN